MNKFARLATRVIVFMLIILATTSIAVMTYAADPDEPHDADSMWVEPSVVNFTLVATSIGDKFNITVWLNITSSNVFGYQVGLLYNHTILNCTGSGFTAGATSDFMSGHTTSATGPTIDDSYLGNGSILAFETCLAPDFVTTPHNGSLIWAEFEITAQPPEGTRWEDLFDITTTYPSSTWVMDQLLAYITITTYDGVYVIPELSLLSILSILMGLVLISIAVRKTSENL